jgi:4-hydroxythreonine-4-phosphate dehydrogenase
MRPSDSASSARSAGRRRHAGQAARRDYRRRPAGIGPEIAARAAVDPRVVAACEPLIYAPQAPLSFSPGVLSADAGRAAYDTLLRAVDDVRRGVADAIATAPINKEAWRLAGLPWTGHTDLLAHLTGAGDVAMMFYSDTLRVVLATIHIPLAEVPRALTRESLESTIVLSAKELPRFGCVTPRFAVAGLNPHAGEHGLFGREEQDVIAPAIAWCRRAASTCPVRIRLTRCSCARSGEFHGDRVLSRSRG